MWKFFLVFTQTTYLVAMKKILIKLFFIIALIFSTACQVALADDLLSELEKSANAYPEETIVKIDEYLADNERSSLERLKLIALKSQIYKYIGFMEEYKSIAEAGLELARNLENSEYEVAFSLYIAEAYSQMSEWGKSKKLFQEALVKLKAMNNEKAEADAMARFGLASYYNGENQAALQLLSNAFDVYVNLSIEDVPGTLQNIALVFDATGEYDKAIEYYKKSLSYYDLNKQEAEILVIYYNIGYTSIKNSKLDDAEYYLKKAEEIARRYNIVQGIAFSTSQLGLLNIKQANFESAKAYLNESLPIAKDLNNTRLEGMVLSHLLETHVRLKEYDDAMAIYDYLESEFMGADNRSKLEVVKLKSEMHMDRQEFRLAAEGYKEVARILEVFMESQKTKEIREMQGLFDSKLKEQENQILKQQNELQRLKISKQKTQAIIYVVGAGGLLVTIGFLFVFWKREKQVRCKFSELAMKDELTGAANRRYILERADIEYKRFLRNQTKVAFCMLDLDYFKQVNDTYGHDVGDAVLIEFAKIVAKVIREHDAFGRIGGEEWLLILSQIEEKDIHIVFNRLAELSRAIKIPKMDREITFSMGVAVPQPQNDSGLDSLLKCADQALYDAKENGRNCFVIRYNAENSSCKE